MTTTHQPQNNAPVWLVTGTSSGLGLALAQHVLSQGHNLISTSRHATAHEELVAVSNSGTSGALHHFELDLSTTEATVKKVVKSCVQVFNRIDVVVNMAAVVVFTPVELVTSEALDTVMRTNFLSPLWITQSLLPVLRASSYPLKAVINVSSCNGVVPAPAQVLYDSSKRALESMGEALAAEVAPFGIRSVIIDPGAFRTKLATKGTYINLEGTPYGAEDHPVRKRMEMVSGLGSVAKGDPAKSAAIIFDLVTEKEEWTKQYRPGGLKRLILGSDCWGVIDRYINEFRHNVDANKELAASTNADD